MKKLISIGKAVHQSLFAVAITQNSIIKEVKLFFISCSALCDLPPFVQIKKREKHQ